MTGSDDEELVLETPCAFAEFDLFEFTSLQSSCEKTVVAAETLKELILYTRYISLVVWREEVIEGIHDWLVPVEET